ncbi:MAG TPA: hypothetical protein DHW65_10170 [Dehalococcoidia bacterium]|nr:hypothetical protein [Chloroflexota bacterium]MQF96181.1 hypothetical protein [SAR202 cluster bacterium]HAA95695.1 hypothetical protein [Dehalococcoidia bacterium]HCL26693.1 hypothetical protein [Dehalococcoidia bacterium]|tara:strand:- start:1138 stop:1698 length:561 start_codon:yes stop_codon:yes gene_type:complete
MQQVRELFNLDRDAARLQTYRKKRWSRSAEFHGWLQQDALESLDQEQALALYRASGGRETAKFKTNPLEEVRDSIDFLLYDNIKLEGRFDECATPGWGYCLAGTGKEFPSYLLCLINPSLFGVWNSNAERLLKRTGLLSDGSRRGPMGIRYLDILDSLNQVRVRSGLGDFREIDELAYQAAQLKST